MKRVAARPVFDDRTGKAAEADAQLSSPPEDESDTSCCELKQIAKGLEKIGDRKRQQTRGACHESRLDEIPVVVGEEPRAGIVRPPRHTAHEGDRWWCYAFRSNPT